MSGSGAFRLTVVADLARAAAGTATPGEPIKYGGKNPGPPPGAADGAAPS